MSEKHEDTQTTRIICAADPGGSNSGLRVCTLPIEPAKDVREDGLAGVGGEFRKGMHHDAD